MWSLDLSSPTSFASYTNSMRYVLILSFLATTASAHDWSSHKWSQITDQQRACIANLNARGGYGCCRGDDVDKVSPKWNFGSNSGLVAAVWKAPNV